MTHESLPFLPSSPAVGNFQLPDFSAPCRLHLTPCAHFSFRHFSLLVLLQARSVEQRTLIHSTGANCRSSPFETILLSHSLLSSFPLDCDRFLCFGAWVRVRVPATELQVGNRAFHCKPRVDRVSFQFQYFLVGYSPHDGHLGLVASLSVLV